VSIDDTQGRPEAENQADYEAPFQAAALEVVADLGLAESETGGMRPTSGHHSSILLPCDGVDGRSFLLKYFLPPREGQYYPSGVKLEDYARRECAFYRYLDTVDAERRSHPVPKTVLLDNADPPRWILLERIAEAVGPAEEVLGMDHIFRLLQTLAQIPVESLRGRRNFPLNRWDAISYLDRVRMMYDPILRVIGEDRWTQVMNFFQEALRWIETRPEVVVHGDFTAANILIDEAGEPFLLDFERVGTGNEDHDFAWFWIHSDRSKTWKQGLLERFFGDRVGSERVRANWGIRAAIVYLALRRLRFSFLILGEGDPNRAQNLGLLDAALIGDTDLFPV
jgi:Phosphotransferase enzyme family